MKKLGIVIVNWNSLKYTLEFIKTFESLKLSKSFIIIINNSPKDNQKLDELRSESIRLVNTNENLGYAGGLNKGIKYLLENTDSEWILLVNNDVKLTQELFYAFDNLEDKNTIYSPVIVNTNDDIVQNTGGGIRVYLGGTINLNKGVEFNKIKKLDPDFISGCCMYMHKDVIKKVGYFDEEYGSYFEDVDFSLRAKEKGIKLQILWDTMLRHYHSMSTKNISGFKDFLITRNSLWFARRDLKFPKKQIFMFFAVVVGFFSILPRPKNLPFYFRGVIKGLT